MASTMVTGGMGFVGRHLVPALVQQGHRVVTYNRDFSAGGDPSVTPVQGELFDIPRLVRTLQEHDVDRILHTAAMSHPELSIELPITTVAANIQGTVSVLEAARMAEVARVVNFSSECAYGDQLSDVVREDARLRPSTPYGVTKVSTELLADVYTRLYGVRVVSLRITEVYGPGNPMPSVLPEMLRAAIDATAWRLERGAEHRFQFVHVEDVAQAAISAAVCDDAAQSVYNISGGRQVSVAETIGLVRSRFPDADLHAGPGYIETLDRQGEWDISAAGRDLGYTPRWTLEDGVRAYADWLLEHPY